MNEIAKKNIQEKLEKAMTEEVITPGNAAKLLRLPPSYISMIRNEKSWRGCSESGWNTVLLWINSGVSMREYAEKHAEFIESTRPKKEIVKENTEIAEFTKVDTDKLISLLKTERLSLEKQINAIDVLLECYSIK